MVDDLKTLEVPESVDNPLGLKGKLAEVTEKVTQAAADQGMKDKNLVRTGFPWLVAGGIGVVGLLIAEPLGAIGKAILGVPRGLSKQIGKQVEKIPYIGLILSAGFAAITEGIEALGAASGYIATGVASFLTFKMLQTQGTEPEKHKDVPLVVIPRGNSRVKTAEDITKEKAKAAEKKAAEEAAKEEAAAKDKATKTNEETSPTETKPKESSADKATKVDRTKPAEIELKEVLKDPTASRKGTFVQDEGGNWYESDGKSPARGTKLSSAELTLVKNPTTISELNNAMQKLNADIRQAIDSAKSYYDYSGDSAGKNIGAGDYKAVEETLRQRLSSGEVIEPDFVVKELAARAAANLQAEADMAKTLDWLQKDGKGSLDGKTKPTAEESDAGNHVTAEDIAEVKGEHSKRLRASEPTETSRLATELIERGKVNQANNLFEAISDPAVPTATTATPEVVTPAATAKPVETARGPGVSVRESLKPSESLGAKALRAGYKPRPYLGKAAAVGEAGLGLLMDGGFLFGGWEGLKRADSSHDVAKSASAGLIGGAGLVSKTGLFYQAARPFSPVVNAVPKMLPPGAKKIAAELTASTVRNVGAATASKVFGEMVGTAGGLWLVWDGVEQLRNNPDPNKEQWKHTKGLIFTGTGVVSITPAAVAVGQRVGLLAAGKSLTARALAGPAAMALIAAQGYDYHYAIMDDISKNLANEHEQSLIHTRPGISKALIEANKANSSAPTAAHQETPDPDHFPNLRKITPLVNARGRQINYDNPPYFTDMDPVTKKFPVKSPEELRGNLLWLEGEENKLIYNIINDTDKLNLGEKSVGYGYQHAYADQQLIAKIKDPYELEKLMARSGFAEDFKFNAPNKSEHDIRKMLETVKAAQEHLEVIQAAKVELGGLPNVSGKSKNDVIQAEDGSSYFIPKQAFSYVEYKTPDGTVIPKDHPMVASFDKKTDNSYEKGVLEIWGGHIAGIPEVLDVLRDGSFFGQLGLSQSGKEYIASLRAKEAKPGNYIEIKDTGKPVYDPEKDEWKQDITYRNMRPGTAYKDSLLTVSTITKYEPKVLQYDGMGGVEKADAPLVPTYETYYNTHKQQMHEVENLVAKIEANPLPKESASAALQLSEKFRAASMNGNEIGGTGNRVFDDYVGAIAGYWEDKEKAAKLPAGDAHGKAIIAVDERKIGEIYLAMQLRQEALEEHKDSFNDHKKFIENKDNLAKMEVLCANQIAWNDYKDACKSYETVCAQTKTFDKETAEILRADAEITMYLRMPMLNKAMQEEVTKTSVEQIKGDKEFLTKLRIIGETADMNATVAPTNAAPEIMPVDPSPKPVAYELAAVATKVAPVKYRTVLVQQGTTLSNDMQIAGQPLMVGFVPSQVGGMPQGFIPSGQLGAGSAFANHNPALGQPGFMPVNNSQNGFVPLPDNKPWLPIYVPQHIEPPSGFIPVDNPQAAVFNVPPATIQNEKSAQKNKDVATMTPQDIGANLIANLTGAWQEVLGENGVPMQTTLPIKSSTDKSQQA